MITKFNLFIESIEYASKEGKIKSSNDILNKIINIFGRNGYTVDMEDEDELDGVYVNDGILSICDRISPNITSGEDYEYMVDNMKKIARVIEQEYGEYVDVEYHHNDEWFSVKVYLKCRLDK